MKKVNKHSPLPLHHQLKMLLAELIENEVLQPDDPIPTERELCEFHGISRMTVNKAIMSLVNDGLVYRERGRGTFVLKPKERHQLSCLLGFTEEMQRRGLAVNTKILSFERTLPTKKIQQALALRKGQSVFAITRLRCISGEPYALETAYLPCHLCNDLSKELLTDHSLYQVLARNFSLEMDHASQSIEPVLLNDYESSLLGVAVNSLALLFSRQTYLEDGTPMEVTKAIYRSDRYKFEITLRK
jgi:GntR family transcriptional regulator